MAKSAKVKNFTVEQALKNNGIEIQVDDNDGQFGDIYVAKTGIIWCKGKIERDNGVKFSFDDIQLLAQYKNEAIKAAKDAQKQSQK